MIKQHFDFFAVLTNIFASSEISCEVVISWSRVSPRRNTVWNDLCNTFLTSSIFLWALQSPSQSAGSWDLSGKSELKSTSNNRLDKKRRSTIFAPSHHLLKKFEVCIFVVSDSWRPLTRSFDLMQPDLEPWHSILDEIERHATWIVNRWNTNRTETVPAKKIVTPTDRNAENINVCK